MMTNYSSVDEGVTKLPPLTVLWAACRGVLTDVAQSCDYEAVAVPAEDISPIPPTGGLFV